MLYDGKVVDISGPLFVNHRRERLNVCGIEDICKKAFELMGLSDCGFTTHSLRHTYATIMYQQTKDILLVQKLLGHDSILTTQIYLRVYPERVREAVNKNPLNMVA